MEGLSLGLIQGGPPLAGCVRWIALTCGFTFPVQSRTLFRTATDQTKTHPNLTITRPHLPRPGIHRRRPWQVQQLIQ